MAGYIAEFFGYRSEDSSQAALAAVNDKKCPFLGTACTKLFGRTREIAGVCSIRQKSAGSPNVICCPNRIYAEDYKMLRQIASKAFGQKLQLFAGRAAVEKAKDFIMDETIAATIENKENLPSFDINGHKTGLAVEKVQ